MRVSVVLDVVYMIYEVLKVDLLICCMLKLLWEFVMLLVDVIGMIREVYVDYYVWDFGVSIAFLSVAVVLL